ncbi:hypothetical protein C2I36_15065 [Rhodobacteraceae bacterium WD3A24]|nr:hypothetical protein C2I36_15065 [Rhodobacteraceae bacterium WD3A24]
MPERTMPGLGLRAFYDPGQGDWGTTVSEDLRKLSALVQLSAKSRTTTLPASGTAGDIYIVPSGAASNANDIALWDGPSGSEAWVYITPAEGWEAWVEETGERVRFDGSGWVPAGGGASGEATVTADASASRTLALADAGAIIEMTSGSANTVTIPAEASVDFPVGALVNISQVGAGTTTIAGDTGVTLNGVGGGSCTIDAQWGGAGLYKRAADAWVVQGAVSEVT